MSMFCFNNLFPFAVVSDHKLYQTLSQSNNHDGSSSDRYSTKTCLTLKPPQNFSNFFNEFNDFLSQQNKVTESTINCKYFNIKEIKSFNNLNHEYDLSLLRINKCSLS